MALTQMVNGAICAFNLFPILFNGARVLLTKTHFAHKNQTKQSSFTGSAFFHPPAEHKASVVVSTCVGQLCVNQSLEKVGGKNIRDKHLHEHCHPTRVTFRCHHCVLTVEELMGGVLSTTSAHWCIP